jgi:hypothetical protein
VVQVIFGANSNFVPRASEITPINLLPEDKRKAANGDLMIIGQTRENCPEFTGLVH